MIIRNIEDVEGFFNVVEDCIGRVQLITEEGDVLNLKSKLSRLVAISSIFQIVRLVIWNWFVQKKKILNGL